MSYTFLIFSFFFLKNTIDEIKEDCSDLPPIQRKKKLQQKIDEIKQKIAQETNARYVCKIASVNMLMLISNFL